MNYNWTISEHHWFRNYISTWCTKLCLFSLCSCLWQNPSTISSFAPYRQSTVSFLERFSNKKSQNVHFLLYVIKHHWSSLNSDLQKVNIGPNEPWFMFHSKVLCAKFPCRLLSLHMFLTHPYLWNCLHLQLYFFFISIRLYKNRGYST